MNKKNDAPVETGTVFTKEALLKSQRFANRRDALSFLLSDGESYSVEQVETILKQYYEKEVK